MISWRAIPADGYDVAVVGGGAAGMTAAMAAIRTGARVALLERGERLGRKLLMTGNGKCNLGNRDLQPSYYYSDNMAMVASVLERFGTEETIAFFASLGLMVREKRGYLYPVSEQAAMVLDVLRYGLEREGVTVLPQIYVQDIVTLSRQGYLLRTQDGEEEIYARKVILACGGRAYPRTGSDGSGYELAQSLGHHVTMPVPSLVQLHCGEKYCRALAGVRAEGTVRIYPAGERSSDRKRGMRKSIWQETGEIQFTEHGISGIPVFQLSGAVNQLLAQGQKLRAELDLFPGYGEEEYEQLCQQRLEKLQGRTVEAFFTGMLHKKIMNVCIRQAGLSPEQEATVADRRKLRQVLTLFRSLPFSITGSHSFDSAQVCRGGVSLDEVDEHMQSRYSPGLYLAGELLNVDGRCGGYNLQWAWASGYLAGEGAGLACCAKDKRKD
ncbi:MAG: aminoacetone oxidase family FAD-binding enzyme [bacterium]|nr:aminoacetone oxidase family FAD-binding enzyme [bacterium]MCM1376656.1 aminoacetone oxidase family FAD-binding enzyme [Muribaculum sp.]